MNSINTFVFLISGAISIVTTLFLILYIYFSSPSTRNDIDGLKITNLIIALYLIVNLFYFFNLIPPVPLALEQGMVAQHVEKQENRFTVTYNPSEWTTFWRTYSPDVTLQRGDRVFAFTSIFAPADFKKSVHHRWKWYNPSTESWNTTDKIGYDITGGRDGGYRGYTYKQKLNQGKWNVEVVTQEELVLGSIDFRIYYDSTRNSSNLTRQTF